MIYRKLVSTGILLAMVITAGCIVQPRFSQASDSAAQGHLDTGANNAVLSFMDDDSANIKSSVVAGADQVVMSYTDIKASEYPNEEFEGNIPMGVGGVVEENNEPVLKPFKTSKTYYVSASKLNIRSTPDTSNDDNIIDTKAYNDKVEVLGEVQDTEFYYGQDGKETFYLSYKHLSSKKLPEMQSVSYSWNGPKLTRRAGTIQGPSGKETYYNLPMGGVLRIMRRMGNNDKYWVRSDGCKMLGQYIMVAADLSIRPRGSHVPTSLGMGVVCDTGTFIYSNRTQIDICTTW